MSETQLAPPPPDAIKSRILPKSGFSGAAAISFGDGGNPGKPDKPTIPEGPVKKEFDSPNLRRLKGLIHDFQQATVIPEEIKPQDLDPKWAEWGLKVLNLSHPTNYEQNSQQRRDLIRTENMESGYPDHIFRVQNPFFVHDRLEADLKDLRSLAIYQADLRNKVSVNPMLGDSVLISDVFNQNLEVYKRRVMRDIVDSGVYLFSEDVIEESGLPIKEKPGEEWEIRVDLLRGKLKAVAMGMADPDLKRAYFALLDPLQKAGGSNVRGPLKETAMMDPDKSDDYLKRASELLVANFNIEELELLKPTPKELETIYDVVSEPVFKNLFNHAGESWDGTGAATILSGLRDPRALPGLFHFLRLTTGGHTGAYVSSAIFNITENPIDREALIKVAETADPVTRQFLQQWFISPSAVLKNVIDYSKKDGGYVFAQMVHNAPLHLVYAQLANMAYDLGKREGKEFSADALYNYVAGNFSEYHGSDQIDEFLLALEPQKVAGAIAKSRTSSWREAKPELFNGVVNPKDRNYSLLPKLIVAELGLDPTLTGNLEMLYQSKDLQAGSFARTLTADGLLYISGRQDGKEILENLLGGLTITESNGQRRVANADPERMRNIFRMMQALDNLGGFTFEGKSSLGELIVDLREKTITGVLGKLELAEADRSIVAERLPFILESGLLDIVPTLLSKYKTYNFPRQAEIVKEVSKHILLNDFQAWRNNLETGTAQLAALPEDKRTAWLTSAAPVEIQINIQKDAELRQAAVDSVRRIAQEAKAHVLDVYKLDFSPERLRQLKSEVVPILEALKNQNTPPEQKKELGIRKRTLDQEAAIVEGILNLESMEAKDLDPAKLLEYVAKLKNSLTSFAGLEQPANDLGQIEEVISTQDELKSVTKLRAFDSDDPMSLLKVGVEPRETCQSWRAGSYNDCLPAYVVDANKRVINVVSDNNEVLGRSVAKLTHIRQGDKMIPAILLEPIYTTSELGQIYSGVIKVALEKAKAAGAVLILKNDIAVYTGADHTRSVPILAHEARKQGLLISKQQAEVFVPQSYNQSEYSDSLGGRVSFFENYVPGEFTIVRPKAA